MGEDAKQITQPMDSPATILFASHYRPEQPRLLFNQGRIRRDFAEGGDVAMKTPRKMTLDEFRAALERYRDMETREGPNGLRRCNCGAVLRAVLVYFSIHD